MHILWTNHPYDKSKNGTKEHVTSAFGEVAVGYAQAEVIQPARRGTPQWLEEMKARSAAATPHPEDTPAPFVNGVRWEIGKSHFGKPVIMRHSGSETWQASFGEIPDACPADVRKQYDKIVREYNKRLESSEQERLAVLQGRR